MMILRIFLHMLKKFKLMYTTLHTKPTIFAHINNTDLVKEMEEQDKQARPNWDWNNDESNSSFNK